MAQSGHIYYEAFGQGHPLVLLHGHTLDRRMWRDVLPALAQHFRVITPDLAGHGRSGTPPGGESMADDVAGLLRRLGIGKAAVCGLSMGGAVAISFALHYPQMCAALIPADSALGGFRFPTWPGPRPYVKMARSEGLAPALAAWMADPLFAPALASPAGPLVRAIIREFPGQTWLEPGASTPDPTPGPVPAPDPAPTPAPAPRPDSERLGEIAAPTLVMVGEHDLPDFHLIADLVTAAIPGARRTVIAGAGHLAPMEQPAAFATALLAFLAQLSGE